MVERRRQPDAVVQAMLVLVRGIPEDACNIGNGLGLTGLCHGLHAALPGADQASVPSV